MLSVQGRMRLGLTGTPIENNLRELKALFDLVLPTYMPQESEYLRLFVKPIQKEDSNRSKALLSRFIRPFVLRRTKEEVLSDLPEKTEELSYCDLSPQQRKLYLEVWTDARARLADELSDKTKPIPYIHIFTL